MSSLKALPHKIKRNYYRAKRFMNETIFVSIPSYKNIELKERQEFYANEVQSIIKNAAKYKSQPLPQATELFENYDYELSISDVSGDILTRNNNGTISYYRGILPSYVPFFKELYSLGILQSLGESGRIVKMKPTNFYTSEYPLIIEVEVLRVVNPAFWSFSMIKQSAINLILIDLVLKEFGYGVIDGHPFNSTFKDGFPVMFDVGSFVKRQECQFTGELIHYYLHTLLMLSMNRSHFSRHNIAAMNMPVLSTVGKGISIEKKALYDTFFSYHEKNSSRGYNTILNEVFNEKIIKPEYVDVLFATRLEEKTTWGSYSSDYFENEEVNSTGSQDRPLLSTDRMGKIINMIHQYSPDAKSTVDLAGNSGYVSSLLAKTGRYDSVINLDYDENAIEFGISKLKGKKVTLYHVNPFFPFGDRDAFAESVKSDVVLALALTHHLILAQHYKIHAIFSIMAMYSNKYVYVEFCPLGDMYGGGDVIPEVPSWYNEEWFEEKFKLFFNLLHKEVLHTVKIKGEDKKLRIMYVGEKKKP
ncbi:MAG TPA: class I SAM-dependent methyltransferase [Ohtaekwangia sp.]